MAIDQLIRFNGYEFMVPLSEMKDSPYQRNKHSQDQISALAKIMAKDGVRQPIHISRRSFTICFGHGRKEAALLNGWENFPIVYQDFDSDDEEYRCVQSDNGLSQWSELDLSAINKDMDSGRFGPFDIALLGIEGFVVEPADKLAPGCDEDQVPEKVDPKTNSGDIYLLGPNRLMCGDSTSIDDVERLMDGEKAELCFTSPPYADQRQYNGGKELSTEHLAIFIRAAYASVNYFAVNLGYSRKNGEVNSYWDDYIKEAKNCGLKFLSWNIWDRSYACSIGQHTAMFPIEHEWIFVFGNYSKELNRLIENKWAGTKYHGSITRSVEGDLLPARKGRETKSHRPMGTILRMDASKERDIGHPAVFPVEFPESYIETMTDNDQIIYEPFGGSGSTLIACEKTNRRCFMMEIDPHYCDVIISRWEKYTGKKAQLINEPKGEWE